MTQHRLDRVNRAAEGAGDDRGGKPAEDPGLLPGLQQQGQLADDPLVFRLVDRGAVGLRR
jgi:hypothetical protein